MSPKKTTLGLNVLRTFQLPEKLTEDFESFRTTHPEMGCLNHIVKVALEEFLRVHKKDRSWLKQAPQAS